MGIADKINEILGPIEVELEEKTKKEARTTIELFMNWLFSNYEFRLNTLSLKPEFRTLGEEKFRDLDDQNFNTIAILAEINGFSRSMVDKLNRIILSSYVQQVNEIEVFFKQIEPLGLRIGNDYEMPTVREYFNCLKTSANVDREDLWKVFARWVVASVNSALGIKHNDVMLILSGSQGLYKTSYLNNLVPNELGKDKYLVCGHIEPSLTNQNTANFLCEKFIINIDDQLEVIFGKEYNSMKAIISVDQVTSRRVYAKFDKTRKRIANFVGTVNSNEFLIDNQNRRYFVIEVLEIDPAYQEVDMCKFWAEAYRLSKKVNPFQVYNREIYSLINDISANYTQSTVEQALISRLFSPVKTKNKDTELFMSAGEVIVELQKLTSKSISTRNVTVELKRMGFLRITRYFKDLAYSRYGYVLYTGTEYAASIFRDYVAEKKDEIF